MTQPTTDRRRPRPMLELLEPARLAGYAVPAFSARYLACIRPVMQACMTQRAPFILEISQRELGWFDLTPAAFRDRAHAVADDLDLDVPWVLHLDHTWEEQRIRTAMDAGFTSVMFDASADDLDRNIARTAAMVEEAHARDVQVEAELGRLTTTDQFEASGGAEFYTDPDEAGRFVTETGCDALAVSVGTAHGAYPAGGPTIDLHRLEAIRAAIDTCPLVLHGGSGVPAPTVRSAIELPGGGIAKMNIATDLEQALLGATGGERRTSRELDELDTPTLSNGLAAVREVAISKIQLLGTGDRA